MRVSAFALSDSTPAAARRTRWLLAAGLVFYFAAHLPFLSPSLEDIDSINYALALRDFDVGRHQPHPPGAPVYVALGRASLAVIDIVAPGLDQTHAETLALSIWSAVAAPIAIVAAFFIYRVCSAPAGPITGLWAALLLAVAPLFSVSALRPMADLPGLAAALVAVALLISKADLKVRLDDDPSGGRTSLVWGAAAAGLAAGIRVQTIWMTLPLLAFVSFRRRKEGWFWLFSRPVAALAGAVLLWAIPLFASSGGIDAYLLALRSQAGADFTWVDMLWANPTPRRLALSLYETFVMPWGTTALATLVGVLAAIGVIESLRRLVFRDRSEANGFILMTLAFAPYVVFHLLFHETLHVRYALPAVVPVAWLAAQGGVHLRAMRFGGQAAFGRIAPVVHVLIVGFAAFVSFKGAQTYAAEAHPAFRAIADMSGVASTDRPAALYSHYSVRRPLQAEPPDHVRVIEPPRTNEWKDLVEYWRSGGSAPVWFLADSRRTDLAVVDPQSRASVTHYPWNAVSLKELGGVRPGTVDWYRFEPPGWFVGEGWALTPELGGVAQLAGLGVDRRPIEAMVRRRSDRTYVIVGARHLGTAADGGAAFSLAVDGREVDRWQLDPSQGANVLKVIELPAGALDGTGRYARLTIAASALNPSLRTPPVAIRQFDVQSEAGLIHAFDEGWHEAEYENASGLQWRWTSERSVLRIVPPQAVRLRLRGESPLKYFDIPPTVRIKAGDRVLAAFRPDDDFEWTLSIQADVMNQSGGRIAIETEPVYVPAVVEGTTDVRKLGLRLFEVDVSRAR